MSWPVGLEDEVTWHDKWKISNGIDQSLVSVEQSLIMITEIYKWKIYYFSSCPNLQQDVGIGTINVAKSICQ
ncbi:unnamed protein product [Sphenostylis stenocarpa]|uniref:Uncharacterized protein n=1 Tax=Sphenostylis stenocarpa TaxID=92480 RepID=A0AA86VYS1_9FABA|nr:unnamed protein product [Sphenostylis stenocarpa]